VFYGSRFYDPLLSRWAQPDSIIPQTQGTLAWDRYSYVNNSPVNYTDPTGHSTPIPPSPFSNINIPVSDGWDLIAAAVSLSLVVSCLSITRVMDWAREQLSVMKPQNLYYRW